MSTGFIIFIVGDRKHQERCGVFCLAIVGVACFAWESCWDEIKFLIVKSDKNLEYWDDPGVTWGRFVKRFILNLYMKKRNTCMWGVGNLGSQEFGKQSRHYPTGVCAWNMSIIKTDRVGNIIWIFYTINYGRGLFVHFSRFVYWFGLIFFNFIENDWWSFSS